MVTAWTRGNWIICDNASTIIRHVLNWLKVYILLLGSAYCCIGLYIVDEFGHCYWKLFCLTAGQLSEIIRKAILKVFVSFLSPDGRVSVTSYSIVTIRELFWRDSTQLAHGKTELQPKNSGIQIRQNKLWLICLSTVHIVSSWEPSYQLLLSKWYLSNKCRNRTERLLIFHACSGKNFAKSFWKWIVNS